MATRNRTDQFVRLRSALSSRRFGGSSAPLSPSAVVDVGLRPMYMDLMDDVKTDVERVKSRMEELKELHKEHLTVTFDAGDEDASQKIEIVTGEIKRLFKGCETKIKSIGIPPVEGVHRSAEEEQMRKNIQRSLAAQVMDLSNDFRKDQRGYMQQIKMQKDRRKRFAAFDDTLLEEKSEAVLELEQKLYDPKFTEDQIAEMILREGLVRERDAEITAIAQSIQDLAEMFKDLATLVVEQGSILDRIDYNLEQSAAQVTEAVKELSKASDYQKKARMKLCILLLIVGIICIGIALMVKAV
eukprot:ANDGO_06038.mRNA.1 Syntaxin-41